MADTDIFDIPSAPNNFDLTGKVVMVHDKTQPEASSTVMVDATKLAGPVSEDDLQDVTDRGASTTNALDVNGDTTHVSTNATTGFGFATLGTSSGKGYLAIGKSNGTYAQIYPDNLTGNQTLQLPDTSGTLYVKPYKEYVAILSQSDKDAPVATVLQNELGTVTWSRESAGSYNAYWPGFTPGKTIVQITTGDVPGDTYLLSAACFTSGKVLISSVNSVSQYWEDNLVISAQIIIRVYS